MIAVTLTELITMAEHVKTGLAEENKISEDNLKDISDAIDRAQQTITAALTEVRNAATIAFGDRCKVLSAMMGQEPT